MRQKGEAWSDQNVELILGNLLIAGVTLAAAVVLFGGVLYMIKTGEHVPPYRVFRAEPDSLRTVHGIVQGVLALRARSLIQLGLLLLVATPVARVAFSVLAFARQRDRFYVVITLIVLAVLLYSMAQGLGTRSAGL